MSSSEPGRRVRAGCSGGCCTVSALSRVTPGCCGAWTRGAATGATGAPALLKAASKKARWAAARAGLPGVVRAGSWGVEPGRGG